MLGVRRYISHLHGLSIMRRQIRNFNKGNKILIIKIDDLLSQSGIVYWLNYGTLLGAYRDHAFIKHDYDLDIGIWWKDHANVKDLFLANNFRLVNEFRFGAWDNPEKIEYRFEYCGAYVDVDFYTIDDNGMAYTFNPLLIEGYDYSTRGVKLPIICELINNPINGLSQIDFLGRKFWIPANTEEYLLYNYGATWKSPQSVSDGYNYHNVATNVKRVDLQAWMIKY